MTAPDPAIEKITKALNEAGKVFVAHELTAGETLFALQTMAAHVLATKNKSVENEFIKRLKQDTLDRRVRAVRTKDIP